MPTRDIPTEPLADHVDALRAQWKQELPDLDTSPMEILGRAYRLTHLVAPSIETTFETFGIDRGEFDVLSTLRRSGPPYQLTPTQLYTSLMISSGGLTHRLARLHRKGLITRAPAEHDRRIISARLTEEGRRRTEGAFRADMQNEARILSSLDEREKATLAELLKKLTLDVERQLKRNTEQPPT